MNWFDTLKAKSKGQRALSEWTREDWGYVSPKSKKKGRYAPKAVADSMSSSEKAYENRKKREGTKQGKQHVPRGKSAKKKYQAVEGLEKTSTVNSAGNYTKPTMRKKQFQRIKAGSKGGAAGQWSARKAQMLAAAYKKAGGGYRD
tara:strand:- start:2316 stop:2750 length:435 start_codon:yes stop_codon:yes gene_type:complete